MDVKAKVILPSRLRVMRVNLDTVDCEFGVEGNMVRLQRRGFGDMVSVGDYVDIEASAAPDNIVIHRNGDEWAAFWRRNMPGSKRDVIINTPGGPITSGFACDDGTIHLGASGCRLLPPLAAGDLDAETALRARIKEQDAHLLKHATNHDATRARLAAVETDLRIEKGNVSKAHAELQRREDCYREVSDALDVATATIKTLRAEVARRGPRMPKKRKAVRRGGK